MKHCPSCGAELHPLHAHRCEQSPEARVAPPEALATDASTNDAPVAPPLMATDTGGEAINMQDGLGLDLATGNFVVGSGGYGLEIESGAGGGDDTKE
jgi:hypothetical protein